MPSLACWSCGRRIFTTVPIESLFADERRCPRCGALPNPERRGAPRPLRVRPQLAHDVVDVRAERVRGDRQLFADLPRGEALGERAQDLELARRQRLDGMLGHCLFASRGDAPGDAEEDGAWQEDRPGLVSCDDSPRSPQVGPDRSPSRAQNPIRGWGAPARLAAVVRLAILGLGLIGGSIARALAVREPGAWHVTAWSRTLDGPRRAVEEGVVADAVSDATAALCPTPRAPGPRPPRGRPPCPACVSWVAIP